MRSAREELIKDLCLTAASRIAEMGASGGDVAAYLVQRFGPALQDTEWATLEQVASDDRPLLNPVVPPKANG